MKRVPLRALESGVELNQLAMVSNCCPMSLYAMSNPYALTAIVCQELGPLDDGSVTYSVG